MLKKVTIFWLLLHCDPTPKDNIPYNRPNGLCIGRIYLKNTAVLRGGAIEQLTMQVEIGQNSYVSLLKILAMK